MKAEAFTGAAQRVNSDHRYAMENKALITAVLLLLMFCKPGLKTAIGCMIRADRESVIFFVEYKIKKVRTNFYLT